MLQAPMVTCLIFFVVCTNIVLKIVRWEFNSTASCEIHVSKEKKSDAQYIPTHLK